MTEHGSTALGGAPAQPVAADPVTTDPVAARPAPATGLVAPVPGSLRKETAPVDDADAPSAPARWAAEFAGTALLVFAGLGAGMFATEVVDSALGFGLGLLAALVAFGHVSGGHFNPAVTLAAVVAGRTPARAAIGYVAAQVLGALAAAGVLRAVLGTLLDGATTAQVLGAVANGYGENSTSQAGWPTVLLVEFVVTTLFALVVLGATSRRANAALAPLAIGAALVLLLTVAAPFDGGSLNPARSTGAAVVAGGAHLPQLWLFWAAPLLGGLVAGLVHRVADLAGPGRTRTRTGVPAQQPLGTAAAE
ncbi:aquaporin [Kocuria sp. U4B]